MHTLSIVLRYYPYWAIPLALIIGELGIHFRRRKKSAQWNFFAVSAALFVGLVLWLVFRGDLNSNSWARTLLG